MSTVDDWNSSDRVTPKNSCCDCRACHFYGNSLVVHTSGLLPSLLDPSNPPPPKKCQQLFFFNKIFILWLQCNMWFNRWQKVVVCCPTEHKDKERGNIGNMNACCFCCQEQDMLLFLPEITSAMFYSTYSLEILSNYKGDAYDEIIMWKISQSIDKPSGCIPTFSQLA